MAQLDWKSTPVIMMDFEGSPSSGVVEYGLVRLGGGRIINTETALCRPAGLITEQDADVHGIRNEDVQSRTPFRACFEKFVELRREGIFAAHNRHAENTFLKSVWPVPPVVPDWRGSGEHAQEWGPWIDTLSIYKELFPGLDSYALGELVERFGIKEQLLPLVERHCPENRSRPHCALYDALASALLLLLLEETPELKDRMTAAWLLQFCGGQSLQGELF